MKLVSGDVPLLCSRYLDVHFELKLDWRTHLQYTSTHRHRFKNMHANVCTEPQTPHASSTAFTGIPIKGPTIMPKDVEISAML